jgi:cytochrome b561
MHLRNGAHGYGALTKVLHWLTVGALVVQVAVGLTMDTDDPAAERREERAELLEERGEDAAEARGEAAEEAFEARVEAAEEAADVAGDRYVPPLHLALGLTIVLLAVLRLLWRRSTPLPPWAEHLSARERRLEGRLEKAMLTLLLVVPATGLLMLVVGHDWAPLHVAALLCLGAVVAVHVGLVLAHTVVRRDRHLSRML